MVKVGKYSLYVLSVYLALLTFLHVFLGLVFYPFCQTIIKNMHLLFWATSSLQDKKLLSIVEYLSVCLFTPIFVLVVFYGFTAQSRFFIDQQWVIALMLTGVSIGLFMLSQCLPKITHLPVVLCVLTGGYLVALLFLPFKKNNL